MTYLTLSLAIVILLLFGSGYLHLNNLKKSRQRIEVLMGKHIPKEDFYREMTVAQGSNFSALAMAAWIMLFVAIAYLYFLIPSELPFSYIRQMPGWASSPIGFFIFGIIVAGLAAIVIFLGLDTLPENHRDSKLTELYSFYAISKNMKRYIGLTIPVLGFSIIFSAWNGTIYPEHNPLLELLSFILLIVSMGILMWPILEGTK
jgi:hypothetical protein